MKKKGGRKERLFIKIIILRENLQQVNFVIYIYTREKEPKWQRTKRKIADNYRFAVVAR